MLENLDSKLKEHFKKYYNKKMKKYLKIFFDPFILIYGLFNFLFSKNNQSTHHSFITIYCITSGFISFLLSQVISFLKNLN